MLLQRFLVQEAREVERSAEALMKFVSPYKEDAGAAAVAAAVASGAHAQVTAAEAGS
jgi:hypothetical protein